MELDRISNLPSDVLAKLLSHLWVREAVRTSVLSSKWRYRSAMLPHLVFDDECVSSLEHISFVNIVDHVLLGHIAPIHKFKLSSLGCLPLGILIDGVFVYQETLSKSSYLRFGKGSTIQFLHVCFLVNI
ncbi:unnamed protein product [Prunus armeniaca]|uniref:F-box domain-containing protein n=1 Tax=Prunus armeniaca TaxID=36596 RepID=A0A6J5YC07_PRUAR|nr:unnamed protein product [Prunus armeniaca]